MHPLLKSNKKKVREGGSVRLTGALQKRGPYGFGRVGDLSPYPN